MSDSTSTLPILIPYTPILFPLNMTSYKLLLLSAILQNIEVEGVVKNGKWEARSQYFVQLYVAGKEVAKSTKFKPRSSVLKWEWKADNEIWFEPSSMMKIVLYRGFGTSIDVSKHLVGQHEGKVVDFLDNNASFFDLTDKKGNLVPVKMRIVLSGVSGSVDNIKEFMDKVDVDISRLPSNDTVLSTASMLGQVLKLTKTIMDQLSQAHPILNASWTIVSSLYQAIQETDVQDEYIQELASTLREMLGTANAIPNLPEIPIMKTNVVEEIGHQSIQVASLIHEYTKLSWAERTVKIQIPAGLKFRIAQCQKSCAYLKDHLSTRIQVDTNIQVHQNRQMLGAIKDNKLVEKIHTWLSPPDSSKNRNEAEEKRQVNTCSWFLNEEQFLQWQAIPGFLWVKGKSGTGKTILCSSIIDSLSKKHPAPAIAHFFFDGRDSQGELQLHNKLIRSLISQFSHQHGDIPVALADLYNRYGDYQQPSIDELQNALQDILNEFFHAYIVIDALDECADREKTLNWVRTLVLNTDQKVEHLHIVVTSRPERDIEKVFVTLDPHSIDVGEATANHDISKYLVLQMGLKFKEYNEITQKQIESSLREHADGSFRWVALQLANLGKCRSEYEIKQQLKNLPRDLDDIYKQMLKEIDWTYHADTMTFLQWLAFSRRPMKMEEIAETITVEFGLKDGPVFNSEKKYKNPRDVLERCSGLVSESGGKYCAIKLSHFSVKEYLLSDRVDKNFRISKKASHSKISEISVAYLLQFDSSEPLTDTMLNSSPLAQYAAEHWIDHAKVGGMDPLVLKLILQLFESETAFLNWIRIWDISTPIYMSRKNLSMKKTKIHSLVFYASLAGLEEVLYHLLENGAEANVYGGYFGNALQAASGEGHEAIVRMLLENGAEVNTQEGQYQNALQAASYNNHVAIVKMLLKKGAAVNTQGGPYWTALLTASCQGHETVVKVLLEHGAKVNAQDHLYGNALQAASYRGHEAVVKVLLENGAEVNLEGDPYSSALQAASCQDHEAIVKVLLENGAEVDAQGGYYGNALQAASYKGHKAIVKTLLENGAEVNSCGGPYGNALHAASYDGHEAIVEMLLQNGVDVNTQGGPCGNALQVASIHGWMAIVKMLLEHGAEANAQGGPYMNALQGASHRGHEAIVKILLENGADVNAQGGNYENSLQAASYGGHEAIVRVLLQNGAEVNTQGGQHNNALQAASYQGHEAIVRMLLEKGADVNAQGRPYEDPWKAEGRVKRLPKLGERYGNALHAASYQGHEAIVKVLLENGANVNAQGGIYANALHAACSDGGHEAIVRVLLEHGAEVNIQGGEIGNALEAASYWGHIAIVKTLLENGAEVNIQGGSHGNALQAASCRGHKAIVEVLLENGAEVNAYGGMYENALKAASVKGHEAIMEMLLDNGAVENTQKGPRL